MATIGNWVRRTGGTWGGRRELKWEEAEWSCQSKTRNDKTDPQEKTRTYNFKDRRDKTLFWLKASTHASNSEKKVSGKRHGNKQEEIYLLQEVWNWQTDNARLDFIWGEKKFCSFFKPGDYLDFCSCYEVSLDLQWIVSFLPLRVCGSKTFLWVDIW